MDSREHETQRQQLLSFFQKATVAVQGAPAVRAALTGKLEGEWYLIAIGKAAASMAEGAAEVLGEQLKHGLVITKTGHFEGVPLDSRFVRMEAEHPVPAEGSLLAGRALLEYCDRLPAGAQVLCCVSGGASSLVEALPEGLDLYDLRRVTNHLLSSGLDIESMNRVRKALSCIKAGRLGARLAHTRVKALYISDVPNDDICVIGSGPLAFDPGLSGFPALPDTIAAMLPAIPLMPYPAESDFGEIEHTLVANLDIAKQAAADAGRVANFVVTVYEGFLDSEAGHAGRDLVTHLIHASPGLHIWGGETVVNLPPFPGRGGRNQHLALAAAVCLAGRDDILLLAAGTDGSDGPTGDAGALVDGKTLARGELGGYDAADCLSRADAGTFLESSGDLVTTGPTGTNVMDLVIALKR